MNSQPVGDLKKVYRYSENISNSRRHLLTLRYVGQERGTTTDKRCSNRMERLRIRLNRLTIVRKNEIMKVYSNITINRNISPSPRRRPRKSRRMSTSPHHRRPDTAPNQGHPSSPSPSSSGTLSPLPSRSVTPQRTPSPSPSPCVTPPRTPSPVAPLKVTHIDVKPDKTEIHMVPASFQSDSESGDEGDDEDADIIYPEGVTDRRPYKTIARYRKVTGQSTNFREHPLLVAADSTETLILGLEHFAQQHNCILIFSDKDQQFDQSVYRAACGLADLGSIHLLATDSLLTANFQFEIDLDYDSDITSSTENVEEFVLDFCGAISKVLSCDQNNVRVFSIDKLAKKTGRSRVDFGLTTTDQEQTKRLADKLQSRARSGFSNEKILKHVKPGEYECTWKPLLTHLQIRPSDLDPQHNFDYRRKGVVIEDTRGSYPYYLPIDWYRHAVNVSTKYGNDQTWIGRTNAKGEWSVAFHGTKKEAVVGIVQKGLLPSAVVRDLMLEEAIEQIGEEADQPGLYVATHCNGGSHPRYTTPFTVTTSPDKSETFRIVFQCRVQPGKFTTHTTPVDVGEAWRIVDQKAVRPYGILIKKEN